jgi:hypothetical protein
VTFNVIDPVAPAGIRVHPAHLCCSTRRVMSSGVRDVSRGVD